MNQKTLLIFIVAILISSFQLYSQSQALQPVLTQLQQVYVSNQWRNDQFVTNTYDVNENLIEKTTDYWYHTGQTWERDNKIEYYRDNLGGLDSSRVYIWTNPGVWQIAGRNLYERQTNYEARTSLSTQGGQWFLGTRLVDYELDSLSRNTHEQWNYTSSSWDSISITDRYKNGSGGIYVMFSIAYNVDSSKWINSLREYVPIDNSQQRILVREKWENNSWVKQQRFFVKYNNHGYIKESGLDLWDVSSSQWTPLSNFDYIRNPKGQTQTGYYNEWSDVNLQYYKLYKFIYTYPPVPVAGQSPNTGAVFNNFPLDTISMDSFPKFYSEDYVSARIYPNPAKTYIHIQADKIVIYDLSGRMVLQEEKTSLVDVSSLSASVYVVVIYKGSRKITERLLID